MKILRLAFFICTPFFLLGQSLERVELLLQHPFSEVSTIDVERAQARIDLLSQNNGLRFQTAFTNNDYAGLELGNVWRMSAGLSYDFLDAGLFETRNELKVLKIEKQIAEKELSAYAFDKNYSYLFNYFIYAFNKEKKLLLSQKQFLLNSLLNKNFNLYYNHELNYEEILYLQSFSQEASILLNSIEHLDKLFEELIDVESIPGIQVSFLPILEINLDSLMNRRSFNYLNEIAELKKERVKYLDKSSDQQRLSAYFNLQYRPDILEANRTGFYTSFGVRYSTPLNFDNDEQAKLVAIENQRIDAQNNDFVFNENKELINLVLDYNTKIRQYSNYTYKLKKLHEKKRVEVAVQKVSTLDVASRNDWKNDLEILNVQYELLELKQLLYLSLLRIYNKAHLDALTPYVQEIFLDESPDRFKGRRVLKITEQNTSKYMDEFMLKYLQKNNFNYALWVGTDEIPADLVFKMYSHGIILNADQSMYYNQGLIQVPVEQFTSRGDLELWISEKLNNGKNDFLFFEKIEDLITLDSKTIGE